MNDKCGPPNGFENSANLVPHTTEPIANRYITAFIFWHNLFTTAVGE